MLNPLGLQLCDAASACHVAPDTGPARQRAGPMNCSCATHAGLRSLRMTADQLRTTLTAIGLQSGAMPLSASSLIAFLFLESLLSLLPRSRFWQFRPDVRAIQNAPIAPA